MKNRLSGFTGSQGFKAATLVVLTLIMLIPVSMVKSLIFERSFRALEVKEQILLRQAETCILQVRF